MHRVTCYKSHQLKVDRFSTAVSRQVKITYRISTQITQIITLILVRSLTKRSKKNFLNLRNFFLRHTWNQIYQNNVYKKKIL